MDTPTTNNITLCWMDLAIMELIIRELRPSSASVSRNCAIKPKLIINACSLIREGLISNLICYVYTCLNIIYWDSLMHLTTKWASRFQKADKF
jgi:hypothetical protein